MSKPSRGKPVRQPSKDGPASERRGGRELKIAPALAIQIVIAAAVTLNWQQLFPVPPENSSKWCGRTNADVRTAGCNRIGTQDLSCATSSRMT